MTWVPSMPGVYSDTPQATVDVTGTCKDPRVSLVIATCQPAASDDVRANGAEVRRMLRESAAAGARLAHFPEGFLSGYAGGGRGDVGGRRLDCRP